ncbi:MAG: DUF6603 domain-containing protein [Bacteroidota bacterium]
MATINIPISELDPRVVQIGKLIGILEQNGASSLTLNANWFQQPLSYLQAIPYNPELLNVLETLLGEASGNSLGTPKKALDRLWYPFLNPSTSGQSTNPQPLGIYLVSSQPDPTKGTVIGLGLLYDFEPQTSVTVTPYAYFPLLQLPLDGNTNFAFILGAANYPVELGCNILGPGVFQTGTSINDLSFDGFIAGADIYFQQAASLDLSFVNLKLPGESKGQNTSLQELINNTTVEDWISITFSVLGAQLAKANTSTANANADTAANIINSILQMLGLLDIVPAIDWASLISNPSQAGTIFKDWFRSIVSTPESLKAWLNDWYCIFNNQNPLAATANDHISGDGSKENPYAINILEFILNDQTAILVDFTFAFQIDNDGVVTIFPGFEVATSAKQVVSSISQLGLLVRAKTEVLQGQLFVDNGLSNFTIFPSFEIMAVAANPDGQSPLFSVADPSSTQVRLSNGQPPTFSVGSMQVGFAVANYYDTASASIPAPTFRLTEVIAGEGTWPSIDMTNLSTDTVLEIIEAIVKQSIDNFFQQTGSVDLSDNLQAILGLKAPPSFSGTWPLADQLLLAPNTIQLLINDPMGALGAYYERCLTMADDNGPLWNYMMPSFVKALGGTGVQLAGKGSETEPWRVELINIGNAVAYAQSWLDSQNPKQLQLGFYFKVPVTISAVEADIGVNVDLMQATLPNIDGTGAFAASWFQGFNTQLDLTGPNNTPIKSPTLGGLTFEANSLLFQLGWNQLQQFNSTATLQQVSIQPKGLTAISLGDLVFTSIAWSSTQLEQFAQPAVNVLGLLLIEHGGTLGVGISTILGFLPGLPDLFDGSQKQADYPFPIPENFSLPSTWPEFNLLTPNNPWKDVETQLSNLLAGGGTNMIPAMQMLGWSLTQILPNPPSKTPAGSLTDPWFVSLPNFWNVEVLTWLGANNQMGFGLRRPVSTNVGAGVKLQVSVRADVPGFIITPTSNPSISNSEAIYPRIWLSASMTNATEGSPLFRGPNGILDIDLVYFGASAMLINGELDYGLDLSFTDNQQATPEVIELTKVPDLPQYTCLQGMNLMEGLVNSWMVKVSATINSAGASFPQLQSLLDLLSNLDLLNSSGSSGQRSYGFNFGAWDTLLANPGPFYLAKFKVAMNSESGNQSFLQNLATLLGYPNFNLSTSEDGMQYLLSALGLLTPYPNKLYNLNINGWLRLIRNPVTFFQVNIPALFSDIDLLQLLISQLQSINSPNTDVFNVDSTGYLATLQTPTTKPIQIGNQLILFGSVLTNLKTLSLTLNIGLGANVINSAIVFEYVPVYSNGTLTDSYAFFLQGLPDEEVPPFPPLQLYPFPTDTSNYLAQLGLQIPVSILSTLLVNTLNNYVVPANPVVLKIFAVLGLTRTSSITNKEVIKPLTGIFMQPVEWVLSTDVLGDGTQHLDLNKLGGLLYNLTDAAGIVSPDGVSLKPYESEGNKDGVQLAGLPYGVTVTFTANQTVGASFGLSFRPTITAVPLRVDLAASLAFGLSKGVNINGQSTLIYDIDTSTETYARIVNTYSQDAFSLMVDGKYQGQSFYKPIQLVPFIGLNQFIPGAGDIQRLLVLIGDKLFAALDTYGSADLKAYVTPLQNLANIQTGQELYDFFDQFIQNPLAAFTIANIQITLPKINQFLTDLGISGFSLSSDNKLLYYQQDFSSRNSQVTIYLGEQSLNDTAVFGMWIVPKVQFEWFTLQLNNTGIGIQTPINTGAYQLEYNVEIDLGFDLSSLPIQGLPTPLVSLNFNGNLDQINGPQWRVYPIQKSTDTGTLLINLLPTAQLEITGTGVVPAAQWLEAFATQFLVPFVVDTALTVPQIVYFLDQMTIGTTLIHPGQILTKWGLISKDATSGNYYLNQLNQVFDLNNPVSIITQLIYAAADLLKGVNILQVFNSNSQLLGSISIASAPPSAGSSDTLYGLNVQMQDIIVATGSNGKAPQLIFQLGKWFANQSDQNNWLNQDIKPGLQVFLIKQAASDNSLSFYPKIELVSIGLDFGGANMDKPLVDVQGTTIQGIEPRIYLSLDFGNGTTSVDFGSSILIDQLGFPLGPGFDSSTANGSTNPVAANLLSSGEANNNSGDTNAVNPSFSLSASYVTSANNFQFLLYDSNNEPTEKIWIAVQRSFGPLSCRKVGFGWVSSLELLQLLFDGSVSLVGLTMDLQELEIGIPISTPTTFSAYQLDLAGINVSFDGGPVSINGGFLKDDTGGIIQYTGQALLQAASFSLGAFGSYGTVNNQPSLFVFAFLNTPLGGPPFFFIKGLSGGFGFNRAINLPAANEVPSFPFVAGINNPAILGGTNGDPAVAPSGTQVLQQLGNTYVPPSLGNYWIAAGVNFTSFEIIQSQAIAIIAFGREFEVNIIGMSALKLPKVGRTYANAEMAFKIVFNPGEGFFQAEAVLTSNSWVITEACKLTGGFAFYAWFKDQSDSGAKAGEFALTLGGYNPKFTIPAYYPRVPLLGINWPVSSKVSINGGAYFAMTPSCVMAGGSLNAVYQSGGLKAWFSAKADFLISWKPFYYDISIGVSVGVSYTFKIIWRVTMKAELGADVAIWGPQMRGQVRVNWYIISFTIYFGDENTSRGSSSVINWDEFKTAFLPLPQTPALPPASETALSNVAPAAAIPIQQVTQITTSQGLIKKIDNANNGEETWVIRASEFEFALSTAVPLNKVTHTDTSGTEEVIISSATPFGIKPLGSVTFSPDGTDKVSSLHLRLTYDNTPVNILDYFQITGTQNTTSLPTSLWGTVNNGQETPSNTSIDNVLVGLESVKTYPDLLPVPVPPVDIANLGYFTLDNRNLPLVSQPQLKPTDPLRQDDESLALIATTVMSTEVLDYRNEIIDAILGVGIDVAFDGRLDQLAAYAPTTFQAPPLVGSLGSVGEVTSSGSSLGVPQFESPAPSLESIRLPEEESIEVQGQMRLRSSGQLALGDGSLLANSAHILGSTYWAADDRKLQQSVLQNLYSINQKIQNPSFDLVLGAGTTNVLQLPIKTTQYSIQCKKADFPVAACYFDQHRQFVGRVNLSHREKVMIPAGVRQLVLCGAQAMGRDQMEGWHLHSALRVINPNVILGEGNAIIRPDNPIRLKTRTYNRDLGIIRGAKMVQQNKVQLGGDQLVSGRVETIFSTKINAIGVLLRRQGAEEKQPKNKELLKTATFRPASNTHSELTKAKLLPTSIKGEKEILLFFSVPKVDQNVLISTFAKAPEGWQLAGVLGFLQSAAKVKAKWDSLRYGVASESESLSDEVRARVSIINEKTK